MEEEMEKWSQLIPFLHISTDISQPYVEVSMGATGDLESAKVSVWNIIYSTDICGPFVVF